MGPARCGWHCAVVAITLLAGCESHARPTTDPPASTHEHEWVSLFDGKSVDAWRGYKEADFPHDAWTVKDGTLQSLPTRRHDLITREEFSSFELRLEFATGKDANSGIMYRVTEEYPDDYWSGPEYQVIDDGPPEHPANAVQSTGALYALVAPTNKHLKPLGEWNSVRIVLQGDHIEHWLNGEKIVEADFGTKDMNDRIAASKFAKWPHFAQTRQGHIALQNEAGWAEYRDIQIRRLD